MKLHLIGCSFKTTPLALRERLVFHPEQLARALSQLSGEQGYEALLISTCNRVELLAVGEPDPLDFLANFHGIPPAELRPHLYSLRDEQAVRHLFRVVASLDSLVVGEAQIAGQVKKAYETALSLDATGPLLNTLLPHARQVARRVRSETGISHGHVSVSSAAVDYVREVFDHFRDKTVLVIGAGKMGELTLRALRDLNPGRILVANRSPEKAASVAAGCGGQPLPWDQLDDGLAQADIILSTTGAAEPIVTRERFSRIKKRRSRWPVVILDIAVPRDFDPRIHDGDRIYLFNIDDLKTIRDATLARRREHIQPAER
ncbi:MAG: glutamyl-tRNA reductase, partial [Gemmataceae bacterium]